MALTAAAIKNAKGRTKPYKLTDSDGLFLYVTPNGGRYWRMNYRHLGKQKTLAFAAENLRNGRLVSLFSAEPVEAVEIMALWPRTRDLSPKVRVTVDALAKAFLPSPPWDERVAE
jgi:hypothetical protein